MQLRVTVTSFGLEGLELNHVVRSFEDQDAIAREVARAVKNWVRQVPVRKRGSHVTIDLRAEWTQRDSAKSKE